MYTKVTPKAGQNGPMWLYVGSELTIWPVWLGIGYDYFSMMATFGHPPAEGPGTYARERDPGRGSATGSRKVAPPAGPSHLTPSSPGEAKSRSDEAPRCPNRPRLA